ncbi:hypothetical protein C7999DRAFT_12375 [Corynascus novoguineensis]|uniref:Uncharacterized protein n=1 Tax=Corynascus novoguineensis TaxID=1126955 RepID=A0AAN7HRX3_9PEZI|nr:hypothetical protein C7999DRAFT_12375 [Corynascus novoguineensis]
MPPSNHGTGRDRKPSRRASILDLFKARKSNRNNNRDQEENNDDDRAESHHQLQTETVDGQHHHAHHRRPQSPALPLSSNPVDGSPPRLQLLPWSNDNLKKGVTRSAAVSNQAKPCCPAADVKLNGTTGRNLSGAGGYNGRKNKKATARNKTGEDKEEYDSIREAKANEAARIMYASCMAGNRVRKRRGRARRLVDLATTPSRKTEHSQAERNESFDMLLLRRSRAGNTDPFPELYWRAWNKALPLDLEMDRHGEKWEENEQVRGMDLVVDGSWSSLEHGGKKGANTIMNGTSLNAYVVGVTGQGEVCPKTETSRASIGSAKNRSNEQTTGSDAVSADKTKIAEPGRQKASSECGKAEGGKEEENETVSSVVHSKLDGLPDVSTEEKREQGDMSDTVTRDKGKGKLVDSSLKGTASGEAADDRAQSVGNSGDDEPRNDELRHSMPLESRAGPRNQRWTLAFGARGGSESEPSSKIEPTAGPGPTSDPRFAATRQTIINTAPRDNPDNILVSPLTARAARLPPRPPNNSRDSKIPKSNISTSSSEAYLSGNEGTPLLKARESEQAEGESISAKMATGSRHEESDRPGPSENERGKLLTRPEPSPVGGDASVGRNIESITEGVQMQRRSRRATLKAAVKWLFKPSRKDKDKPT